MYEETVHQSNHIHRLACSVVPIPILMTLLDAQLELYVKRYHAFICLSVNNVLLVSQDLRKSDD